MELVDAGGIAARRCALALVVALAHSLTACATHARWMPALVISGSISRTNAAQNTAVADTAQRERGSWALGAEASVVWLPTTSESRVVTHRPRRLVAAREAECASAVICAWEREARARTSNGLVAEERTP